MKQNVENVITKVSECYTNETLFSLCHVFKKSCPIILVDEKYNQNIASEKKNKGKKIKQKRQ